MNDKPVIKNIREKYAELEQMKDSALADGDRREAKHYDDMMQQLLTKMTSEQRSWCLDDFSEIPDIYKKTWETIKKQEA